MADHRSTPRANAEHRAQHQGEGGGAYEPVRAVKRSSLQHWAFPLVQELARAAQQNVSDPPASSESQRMGYKNNDDPLGRHSGTRRSSVFTGGIASTAGRWRSGMNPRSCHP